MSMQELPDDQLDGLFRKSLEESEPHYDPVAWQIMQDKLNAHDRQQFWQRWLTRSLPVLLLFLLSTSVWLLTSRDRAKPTTVPTTTSHRQVAKAEQPMAKFGEANEERPARSSRSAALPTAVAASKKSGALLVAKPESEPTTVVAPANRPSKSQTSLVAGRPLYRTSSFVKEAPVTRVRKSLAGRRENPGRRVERVRGSNSHTADGIAQTTYFYSKPHARIAESAFSDQSAGRANVNSDGQLTSQLPDVAPADRFTEAVALLSNPVRPRINKSALLDRTVVAPVLPNEVQPAAGLVDKTTGLSVRALIAPDLSTIGLTNFSRPGTNGGLLMEYQYHRWRVQVGVLRSVKVYQATERTYEYSTAGQWEVVPNSIGGRCNMLDIPINLRYDLALTPRRSALPPSRWFVSAGTTTYYMLREDYTYNYDNPTDPKIKYRDWTTETGRYGFSQLNVSAGYERAFTQRLFWQVEPFLKVPLRGVGFYKVNLLSTGAFFSLRYKL